MNSKCLPFALGALAALFCSSFSQEAQAWQVYSDGIKRTWASPPVRYYINPVNADMSQADAIAEIQQAAANWSQQSSAAFSYSYAGASSVSQVQADGKFVVFFRNTAHPTSASVIAEAYAWTDGSNNLIESDIIIYDGGFTFFPASVPCSGGLYLQDVITHEFGHSLGLGHSEFGDASMYATTSYCSADDRDLAPDDINGIMSLYPGGGVAPAAPSNLGVTGTSTSSISLSWSDNATNESGFTIERSVAGGSFSDAGTVGANVKSFSDSFLNPGTSYSYRVRAQNGSGFSGYSNVASAVTKSPDLTPPTAPAGLTAVIQTVAGKGKKQPAKTNVVLNWQASTDNSGSVTYRVYRNGSLIATQSGRSYSDASTAAGVTYNYWIIAIDPSGNASAQSNTASVRR